MDRHTNCLICNSSKLVSLKNYERSYLVECRNCHFVFSEKICSPKTLIEHYTNYPREHYISPITIANYNKLLDKFEKYRKTNNLLDVGCGSGYFLVEAQKRGWHVFGTEYTDEAVKICQTKASLCIRANYHPTIIILPFLILSLHLK